MIAKMSLVPVPGAVVYTLPGLIIVNENRCSMVQPGTQVALPRYAMRMECDGVKVFDERDPELDLEKERRLEALRLLLGEPRR